MRNKILIFLLSILTSFGVKAQLLNDYGAITSGTWTTTTIWRQWDGTGWNTVPASYPNAFTSNVWILNGSTVTVNGTGPYNVSSLRVQAGAKLYANTTAQIYLSVWSNIICDGEIGNTLNYDGLSFNIEGVNCTISGIGIFTASRIRKSAITNPTTTLVIAMNVALRWSLSSATAIYNNVTAGNSRFDVTVNSGCTLNVAGSPTAPANLSVDGIQGNGGVGVYDASGTYNINGTLIVTGIIYATTDNTNAGYNASFNINKNAIAKVGQINSPSSGISGMVFKVDTNATLELTGPNGFYVAGGATSWGTTNNRYNFLPGSTVEYSAAANQSVLSRTNFNSATAPNNDYWNLTTSGSGIKTILTSVVLGVRGNLTINNPTTLDQNINSPDITIGGNWVNWNQTGFNQSLNLSKKVYFQGNGALPGIPQQTITCPGGEVFTNLWVAKTTNASVKMFNSVTITNQLKLGEDGTTKWGILDLNKNILKIENPSTNSILLTGNRDATNNTVYRFIISEDTLNSGQVKWYIGSTFTSPPINDSLKNYPYKIPFGINSASDTIPFGFCKPDSNNIGYLTVSTYRTSTNNLPWPTNPLPIVTTLNNPNSIVDRFWYIGSDNISSNCRVAFTYDSTEIIQNVSNIGDQYWDSISWSPKRGISYSNQYSVIDSLFSNWNTHWILSYDLAISLPVELLNFYGKYYNTGIKLFWSTASEINNDHFDILKSFDGINYFKIHSVNGRGNSNTIINYEYIDYDVCDTLVYYKLKQVDYDGTPKEYDPIAFRCRRSYLYDDFFDILGRKTRMDFDGIKIYQK